MSKFVLPLCYLLLLPIALPAGFNASAGQDTPALQQQDATAPAVTIQLMPVVTGLSSPVLVTNAHDGSNRLFIVEQGGRIKVLQPGSSTPTVFLDINTKVLSGGERGLLGLAFHPQYPTNRRFFVYYTRQTDGAILVAEYHTSAADPNVADTTETQILTTPHPGQSNHNGGMIEFGPDGFLYIGTGDGGGANDPPNNAQNINALLGKILRIDVDHPSGGLPYSSPPSNPFSGATAGADEIFAYGVRNPWRYSFDRGTGELVLGDVGQGVREEIDIVMPGGNYGWRIMEGSICNPNFNGGVCTPPAGHKPPISEYSHSGGRCSITGGYVYRGVRSSLPTGAYVFGDFCTGEIFMMQTGLDTSPVLLDTSMNITSFGQDESGEIYVVGQAGTVDRIVNPSPLPRHTIGVYDSSSQTFYLRNSNTGGSADIQIQYGPSGAAPVVGDWDGNGTTTIGVYDPGNQTFYLRNSNTAGLADLTIRFGPSGAIPLAGDWDGNGTVTIGVYDPTTQTFYLRNTNSPGLADLTIRYGPSGAVPVVGDWDGNGTTTIGAYDPATQTFYLRNSNSGGFADMTIRYGPTGGRPVVGDWDTNGTVTIGVYDPATQTFYLRNSNSGGFADMTIQYGPTGATGLAGNWDGM
jgi:glucose/arabinose dehydrogenase